MESGDSSVASIVLDGREYVALLPDGFGTFIYPQPVTVTDGDSTLLGPLREPNPSQGRTPQVLEKRRIVKP